MRTRKILKFPYCAQLWDCNSQIFWLTNFSEINSKCSMFTVQGDLQALESLLTATDGDGIISQAKIPPFDFVFMEFFHSLAPPQKVHSFSSNFLTGIGRALLVMNSCHFIHLSFGPQEKDCNVYLLWAHWICKRNQFGQLGRYLQTTQTNHRLGFKSFLSICFFFSSLIPIWNLNSKWLKEISKICWSSFRLSVRQFWNFYLFWFLDADSICQH